MQIFSRPNKYGAKKTVIDGITFDSKAEASYYETLKHQEKQGIVKIIELQPKIYLTSANILYKPDFYLLNIKENKYYYVDVKGMKTPVFNIKARLWRKYAPLELHIITKSGRNFKLEKIIEGEASV